ncbi:MAG: SMC-Scp complex subunit ScpB [Rhodospirillaceae bacterium]|nr:SMC-Scp complex subunit ScpB [Rhodospirillaceae bacterium]
MSEERFETLRFLEAVLFAASEPLSEKVLAQRLPDDADLKGLLQELKAHYANRGVVLMQFEDRWSFRTAPDLSHRMSIERKVVRKMTRAAVETLAIIAYHQPVTRAEIEEIRGVAISKGTLDSLLEANWIKPKGRRETPGRPVVWGTTGEFLEHFGLENCEALPGIEELRAAGLLDARSAVSTLGTQAFAAGQISPDDSEDEEEAAAIELRGEPEFDEVEGEGADAAPDLADDRAAGAAPAHLEDDPETVAFAHAKEVELNDAVTEDIDEPARDEDGDQEDAEESGDDEDDDYDEDDDDEGDDDEEGEDGEGRGVRNP